MNDVYFHAISMEKSLEENRSTIIILFYYLLKIKQNVIGNFKLKILLY